MCGIAGIHLLDEGYGAKVNLTTLAAELLKAISHRGGDATGYATFGPGRVHVQKAACDVAPFLTGWRGVAEGTRTVLLHTRWATQGKPAFPENNHPVACGPVYVVHNGHISNDSSLFAETGAERLGFVDSEAIPAVLVDAGWDEATVGLERLEGAYAIAAVNVKHPGELVLARGGWSPLVWCANDHLLVFGSESHAIEQAWRATFGGAAPALHHLWEGEIIRVDGANITEGRFRIAKRKPSYFSWSPSTDIACEAPSPSLHVAPVTVTPLNLAGPIGDTGRCACCDGWTAEEDLGRVFGEMVCGDCQAFLVNGGEPLADSDLALR